MRFFVPQFSKFVDFWRFVIFFCVCFLVVHAGEKEGERGNSYIYLSISFLHFWDSH